MRTRIEALQRLCNLFVRSYKAAAILILNTVLMFLCFELAAVFASEIRTKLIPQHEQLIGEGSPRETVSYYATQDWSARYWYEYRLSRRQRYYPYVGWRRAAFEGQTINIDQNGIRRTPGANCGAESLKVFAFGASTMWGTGAPDWGTIPAYLQAGFEKQRSGPVCVINYGESAYNSTQELLLLQLQLQSGNIPDLVIFYEGPGDIYAAYQSGRAGVPQNLDQITARFERRQNPSPTLMERLTSSHSYSLISQLMEKLTPGKQEPSAPELVTYETLGIDAGRLSDSIAQYYFENYKMAKALAQKYGFESFLFLPPVVSMGNKALTREEKEMKQRLESDQALNELNTSAYRTLELKCSSFRDFFSMEHIFDGDSSLLWIDEFHVTPVGNKVLAQKMLEVINAQSFLRTQHLRLSSSSINAPPLGSGIQE
jgi:lysophospholipase L1-like esterase